MTNPIAVEAEADEDGTGPARLGVVPIPVEDPRARRTVGPFLEALRVDRVALLVLLVFGVVVYVGQSAAADMPDHGDWWTDMALVDATQRIDEFGFWSTRLALPLDDGDAVGSQSILYANWPTAAFQLQAIAYRLGLEPRQVRALPVLETVAAGYVLFCLARLLAGRAAARFALLFFLTAAPIRLLADSFSAVPVDLLGRFTAFLLVAVTAGLDPVEHRSAWRFGLLASTAAIVANGVALGFESFPAACIFAFAYPLLRGRRAQLRPALTAAVSVPAAAIVAVAGARLLLLAALPGPFLEDLRQVRRSAGVRFERGSFGVSFQDEWTHRVWVYLPVLLCVALVAVAAAAVEAVIRRRGRRLLGGAIVVVAESAWIVVAQQHSQRHVHTITLLMLSLTLPAGWLVGKVAGALTAAAGRRRGTAAVGPVLAAAVTLAMLSDPGLRAYGNVATRVDWSRDRAEVAQVAEALGADVTIAVSDSVISRGPVLVYLLDLPMVIVPRPDLAQLAARRPVVFIHRLDGPDPAAAEARAAGATVVVRTRHYEALRLASADQVPRSLDPDG